MARHLDIEEHRKKMELIEKYNVHLDTEKKLGLLVKTLEQNHKHGFISKLFNKSCKICTALKKVKYGE